MTCSSEPGRKVLSRRALLGAGAGAMLAASLPGRLGAVPGPLAARTAWLLVDVEDGTVLAASWIYPVERYGLDGVERDGVFGLPVAADLGSGHTGPSGCTDCGLVKPSAGWA